MKREQVIAELERLAGKLGVIVRYERLGTIPGGLCRIGSQKYIFVNKALSQNAVIEILVSELSSLPWQEHFILPEVRRYFEERTKEQ